MGWYQGLDMLLKTGVDMKTIWASNLQVWILYQESNSSEESTSLDVFWGKARSQRSFKLDNLQPDSVHYIIYIPGKIYEYRKIVGTTFDLASEMEKPEIQTALEEDTGKFDILPRKLQPIEIIPRRPEGKPIERYKGKVDNIYANENGFIWGENIVDDFMVWDEMRIERGKFSLKIGYRPHTKKIRNQIVDFILLEQSVPTRFQQITEYFIDSLEPQSLNTSWKKCEELYEWIELPAGSFAMFGKNSCLKKDYYENFKMKYFSTDEFVKYDKGDKNLLALWILEYESMKFKGKVASFDMLGIIPWTVLEGFMTGSSLTKNSESIIIE